MDIFLLTLAGLLLIVGFLGSFLPILPGVPLSYIGILLMHFTGCVQFSTRFLVLWGAVVVAVQIIDYVVPIWGTKRFGGSKKGVWGSVVGSIVGMFFGPLGIIFGPFLGALAGEFADGKETKDAMKAGVGSFVGFLLGTGIKLVVCSFLIVYYVREVIALF